MLSEIGGNESASTIAKLLTHQELREDARMALEIADTLGVSSLLLTVKISRVNYLAFPAMCASV